MRKSIGNLWTLGGLSLFDLLRRTVRECWQDEVFGQGGRMAFYHFLAIFPCSPGSFHHQCARSSSRRSHDDCVPGFDQPGAPQPGLAALSNDHVRAKRTYPFQSAPDFRLCRSLVGRPQWHLGNDLWAQQGLRSGGASLLAAIGGHHYRPDTFSGGHWFHGGVPGLLQCLSPGSAARRRDRAPRFWNGWC